jgi:hypothetical protein
MKYAFALLFLTNIPLSFGCTMFSIQAGNINYFGNNEDWSDSNPIIGFSSASATNFGFMWVGFSNSYAQGGMNEAGLCFDWYAGFSTNWTADPAKAYFNGDMCKEILRKCTKVEEVINYFETYNIPSFQSARPMYIDKYGNSIILKWENGQVEAEYRDGDYQLQGAKATTIKPILDSQTSFSLPYMADLLNKAHQEGNYPTQYSNIFDTYNSKIYLFTLFDYSQCIAIDLKAELEKGDAIYNIKELYTSHEIGQNILIEYPNKVSYNNESLTFLNIYPNPTSFSTIIQFNVQKSDLVSLKVFNSQGQLVETLVNKCLLLGKYHIKWTKKCLLPKIYYFQLQIGSSIETRKILSN